MFSSSWEDRWYYCKRYHCHVEASAHVKRWAQQVGKQAGKLFLGCSQCPQIQGNIYESCLMIFASVSHHSQSNRIPYFPNAPEEVQCIQCYPAWYHQAVELSESYSFQQSSGYGTKVRGIVLRMRGTQKEPYCWYFTN
jgi:hypothetical protein